MTSVSSLHMLRLPSLRRMAGATHRRPTLPAIRCSSSSPEGEDLPPSEEMSNMLRSFGSKSGSPGPLSSSSSSSSSSSDVFKGFGKQPEKQKPSTTDALLTSLGGVAGAEGRTSTTNNIVLGNDQTEESWRELDGQVNEYPGNRTFKAIGSGGKDFVDAMCACAEKVVGPLHEECVSTRESAKGNYLSVTLSVWVESPDQVLNIYSNMKADPRLKFFF